MHAEVGTLELTARLMGRPPEQEVHVHGDVYPALLAANAVLTALFQRATTGAGQHLDVAMAEVLVYVDEWAAVDLQGYAGDRGPFDIWTHRVFQVGDGTSVAFVGNPTRLFGAWVQALGGDEALLADPRFATEAARERNLDDVLAVLAELTETFADFVTLESALEEWPMFVAEVRSVADLAATPWAAERGLVAEIAPGLGVPAAPWRGSAARVGVAGPAARLGADSREVLTEHGYTSAEVDALVASGAVIEA